METWKTVIGQYAEKRNEALLEGKDEAVQALLPDSEHKMQFARKMERLRQWRNQRRSPVLHETRMSHVLVKKSKIEVLVDVTFKQYFVYEQYGRDYEEQIVERERLWLRKQKGKWHIRRIVPDVTECHALNTNANTGCSSMPANPLIQFGVFDATKHVRVRPYNRLKAVEYADQWWDRANPDYIHFHVDCTNYISQCLFAGGAPMNYTGSRSTGWWYRNQDGQANWSYSWSVANSLYWYLKTSQTALKAPGSFISHGFGTGRCDYI